MNETYPAPVGTTITTNDHSTDAIVAYREHPDARSVVGLTSEGWTTGSINPPKAYIRPPAGAVIPHVSFTEEGGIYVDWLPVFGIQYTAGEVAHYDTVALAMVPSEDHETLVAESFIVPTSTEFDRQLAVLVAARKHCGDEMFPRTTASTRTPHPLSVFTQYQSDLVDRLMPPPTVTADHLAEWAANQQHSVVGDDDEETL